MKSYSLAVVAALLSAGPALAADIEGTTSATFTNPQPGTATTTGVGTPNFTFGDNTGLAAMPNELTFTGNSFSSAFETPFKVGSLFYFNSTTAGGTNITSVDLSLALNFSTPTLPAFDTSFTFDVTSTDNTGDPDGDADFVFFPSSFSSSDFLIGGTAYHIQLVGFGNVVGDGFLASNSSELHVREGSSATADLFAVITTRTSAAPEPATWALMLGGFGAIGGAMRTRRRTTVSFGRAN